MPKPAFCLQPTAMFLGKSELCKSAGITSQMFSSSGGESCIAASPPEQELITVLSTSMMCLHCFLRSKSIHQVFFDLFSPNACSTFKCITSYMYMYSSIDFISVEACVPVELCYSASSTKGCSPSRKPVLECCQSPGKSVTSHFLLLGFEGSANVIQKKSLPVN